MEESDKNSTNKSTCNKSIGEKSNNNHNQINLNNNQINLNNNQISLNDNQISLNDNQINLNDNQQSIDNLLSDDKWIFKLNWNFRDELIKLLGEYTRLLITNKEISINKKESIENNKNELIKTLTKSPLKLDEESSSYDICLNLDNNFKNEIINNLIKNENLIYYKNKTDTNLKNKLIEENNCMITKIINLPVQYLNNDVNLIDGKQFKSRQSKSKGKKLKSKQSKSRKSKSKDEKSDDSVSSSDFEIDSKEFLDLVDRSKRKLDEELMKRKRNRNELNKNLTKLCLVKKDMKKFFENNDESYSEEITLSNIKWSIRICSEYDNDDKKKYLEFYLHAKNDIDDNKGIKWKCQTYYELILKNNLPAKADKVLQLNYTFDESISYGSSRFIEEKELFNLANGFIKDDTIKLEANLRVDKIEKN